MNFIKISDIAYSEFKKFLTENNITCDVIRIYLEGMSCHGPRFNISVDNKTDNDLIQQVKDINFIVDKNLFVQFSGFIFLCGSENGLGDGKFTIAPVFNPNVSNCESCHGCEN
ncbi:HesB-like protein [Clostridium sp. JNZ X4-2]